MAVATTNRMGSVLTNMVPICHALVNCHKYMQHNIRKQQIVRDVEVVSPLRHQ
jgi:hypothetical protein